VTAFNIVTTNFDGGPNNSNVQLVSDGNDLELTYLTEPGSATALMLIGAGLLGRRRRFAV
jgi:hypothetical protein